MLRRVDEPLNSRLNLSFPYEIVKGCRCRLRVQAHRDFFVAIDRARADRHVPSLLPTFYGRLWKKHVLYSLRLKNQVRSTVFFWYCTAGLLDRPYIRQGWAYRPRMHSTAQRNGRTLPANQRLSGIPTAWYVRLWGLPPSSRFSTCSAGRHSWSVSGKWKSQSERLASQKTFHTRRMGIEVFPDDGTAPLFISFFPNARSCN